MIKNDSQQPPPMGAYGEDTSPTVGVTISPWLIVLAATVWLAPKLFHTWATTRKGK
jgi:hypothetical protein